MKLKVNVSSVVNFYSKKKLTIEYAEVNVRFYPNFIKIKHILLLFIYLYMCISLYRINSDNDAISKRGSQVAIFLIFIK